MNASNAKVIAKGNLHDPQKAELMMDQGADIIALGRGALSNPSWPQRVRAGEDLAALDPALLQPLGDIKPSERI